MQEEGIQQIRQQVTRYLRTRCHPQEVDDLVQDCLYRVLLAEARGLKTDPQLVCHICHAVWVDHLRRHNRRAEMERAVAEQDCVCCTWEEQMITSMDVDACLQALTASEHELVQMRYVDGETCVSIGERLGISEQAVKKRLQRLKQKLRKMLVDYGGYIGGI